MTDEKKPDPPGAVVIPFPGTYAGVPEPIPVDIMMRRKAAVVGALRQALEAAYNNQLESVLVIGLQAGGDAVQLHYTPVTNAAAMVKGMATATIMIIDRKIP